MSKYESKPAAESRAAERAFSVPGATISDLPAGAGPVELLASVVDAAGSARTLEELVASTRRSLEAGLGVPVAVTIRGDSPDSRESSVFAFAGPDLRSGLLASSPGTPLVVIAPVVGGDSGDATLTVSAAGDGGPEPGPVRALLDLAASHVAACAGLILTRERMLESSREAEALHRAATLLVDAADLDSLIANILDAIDEHFGHPICSIYLLRNGHLELVGLRGHDMPPGYRRLPLDGPGVSVRAARQGRITNVPNVRLDGDYLGAITGTRSELAVPLRVDSETIGVINLESPTDRAFGRREERLLLSFADQAARAIRSARLDEEARRRAEREALVNLIVTAVNRTRDLDEIFRIFCHGLSQATGAERTYIATIDWQERVAQFVHAYSRDGRPGFTGGFPLAALPELSERLWQGHVVAVADVLEDPIVAAARASYERYGTGAVMYVPVVRSGDWAAVLTLCSDRAREWTEDEVSLARTIGEQVGTAILQAELFKEINDARRQWETTFDTMSDGVLFVGDSSKVLRANAAATTLLRVSRPDLLEMTCCQALACVGEGACPVHAALSQRACVIVHAPPHMSGRPTLVTVDPVAGGGGAVVVLRDLSALRKAEEEARRQHVIVQQLARSSADLIAMLDRDGKALWHNEAFAGATGCGSPEAGCDRCDAPADCCRGVADRVATSAREAFRAELARALGGEPRFFETTVVGPAGREARAMVSLTPVLDDRAVGGVLFVGRDVTAQRRDSARAAEAEKLRALGQLSSGVAHNFNNALAVILGRTQLLRRKLADSPLERDLDVIERVSHEASHTVRRIQNFARKRRRDSFAPVDLKALLADTLDITSIRWRADSQSRGVRYDVGLDEADGDFTVLGDAAELREVLLNIIFNALDAMPGGGALRAAIRARGGFVDVSVADTGQGMTEEARRRVFEPFFTTKEASGTGLGLAVSYGIISRHDGRIEFVTRPGEGTTFTVSLPAYRTREAAAGLDAPPAAGDEAGARARVLVVDDEETVRELVAEALAIRGHDVRQARDGEEAVALLAERRVDVVVTDYAMPGIDGAALVARVRAAWPATRVLLVSGTDVESLALPGPAGPDLVLPKPFTLDELCAAVETLVAAESDADR